VVPPTWDEKDVILKNEPEKLLKTKDRHLKTNRNEPENEAEKLLKTGSCGKNEAKTNRRTKRAMLLIIKASEKAHQKRTGADKGNKREKHLACFCSPELPRLAPISQSSRVGGD
jgi:hypothetical protein